MLVNAMPTAAILAGNSLLKKYQTNTCVAENEPNKKAISIICDLNIPKLRANIVEITNIIDM
jgi:hypothetical protein